MVGLLDKDFKTIILKMFKELKEDVDTRKTMYKQNINNIIKIFWSWKVETTKEKEINGTKSNKFLHI